MKKILLFCIITFVVPTFSMDNKEKFFKAIEVGDPGEIKRLFADENINLDRMVREKNSEGDTALMIAIKKGNVPLAQELLRLGADIQNQINKTGQTALILAINSKNSEMVTTLLNNARDRIYIDQPDGQGDTPLIEAMKTHNKDIIKAILSEVPNPFIANGNKEIAEQFATSPKEKKFLALAESRHNLYEAIEQNKTTEDIKNLLTSELSPNALKNIESIERNPLLMAIEKGRLDVVELLVDKGADVTQKLKFGFTPLLWAVSYVKPGIDIVKFLLKKGADSKVVFTSQNDGTSNITLLMAAVERGDVAIFKLFLEAGVNPLLKDSEGRTALDYAQNKISSASDEEKNNFNEIIFLLFSAYIQHLTEALNMLQGMLIK